jgi:hypothetical protein
MELQAAGQQRTVADPAHRGESGEFRCSATAVLATVTL